MKSLRIGSNMNSWNKPNRFFERKGTDVLSIFEPRPVRNREIILCKNEDANFQVQKAIIKVQIVKSLKIFANIAVVSSAYIERNRRRDKRKAGR